MSIINPSTLFHFTRRKSVLKAIVKTGLKYSYCFEEISRNVGYAVPMICFCDIPLLRTINHRKRYGSYMVGIDKSVLLEPSNFVSNPVEYKSSLFVNPWSEDQYEKLIESINSIYNLGLSEYIKKHHLAASISNYGIKEIIDKNENFKYESNLLSFVAMQLRYNIAFSKQYETINDKRQICNYDEREWRIIPHQYINDTTSWLLKTTKDDFIEKKKEVESRISLLEKSHITFDLKQLSSSINFIVVKKDMEIEEFIRLIKNSKTIFGLHDVPKNIREFLISKITSFETIEKNY
jgi:hypothetical protein